MASKIKRYTILSEQNEWVTTLDLNEAKKYLTMIERGHHKRLGWKGEKFWIEERSIDIEKVTGNLYFL